jgi:hypothetical protein
VLSVSVIRMIAQHFDVVNVGPGFSTIGAAIQFTKMGRAEHGALSRTACPETHTI